MLLKRGRHGAPPRADLLAVLWFVSEIEGAPITAVRSHCVEERFMESHIFQRAERRGEVRAYADMLVQALVGRMGTVDPTVEERIRSVSDLEMLKRWTGEAVLANNAETAGQVAEKIRKACPQ